MKFKHILILASALAVLAGCKKSEEVEPAKVSLKPGTIAVSGAGDTKTLSVTANGEWKASVNKEWVHIAPISGNASTKSITVLVDENTTGAERSAVITVTCGSAKGETTVNQSADATEEGTIANADDFLAFVKDAAAATEADEFNISADIDLGGAEIAPIPAFAGVLDGNNHKVYNYKVVSKEMTSGLILTNNGVVKNLILGSSDGTSYDGKSEVGFDGNQESAPSHIGGVCALNAGTIENVKQFAKVVTIVGNTAITGISGLVGAITSPATVKDCENHASVVATGTTAGETYIAGVAGYVNNADALIDHCVNKAPVEVTIAIVKASMFAGVVARCNLGAKVVDCQNLAPVKYIWSDQGQSGNYIMVAGVVGALYTTSSAIRCVNKAIVSSTNQQVTRMGGIVGTLNSQGTVEECVNEGEVNLNVANDNGNWQSVAGIVGFEEKVESGNVIRKNVNKGDVNVDVKIVGTHTLNRVHVGGILGVGNLGVELYENVNEANITAINRAAANGSNATQMEVGGIVGGLRGTGTFSRDNENKGAVSCTGPEFAMAGGIAGHMGSLAGATEDALLTMENDKNTGAVVGSDASKTGSIAGVSTATITGSTAAGSVNGTTLTDANFVKLAVGTNTGKLVDLKSPTGGTASSKELAVSPLELRVAADAVSASFTVTSNAAWTVSTTADWLTSYTTSGTNDGTVEVAFAAYTSKDADREAVFTATAEGADPVEFKLIQTKVLDTAPHNIPSADEFKLFLKELQNETPDLARWQDNSEVIKVEADIDLDGEVLLPGKTFSGVLDGQNHKIYNFKVASKENNSGLILTNNGTIKNLVLGSSDGTSYDGKSEVGFDASAAKNNHIGGLCAYNAGTIENVKQFAKVVCNGTNGETSGVGGIAGSSVAVASFKNCHNYAQLSITGNTVSETYIGGIVGNVNTGSADIVVSIENCVNHVAQTLGIINAKAVCFGGVVGRTNFVAELSYCTNDADISYVQPDATGGTFIHIAGVAGAIYNNSSVKNCVNNGKVSSDRLQVSRIGGVVGTLNKGGIVSSCTNNGEVVLKQKAANDNWQSAGGIVGFHEAVSEPNVIKDNTNNASVTVEVENATTHGNKVCAGGIIGLSANVLEISGNTNKGAVSVTNAKAGRVNAGGIIGWMNKASSFTSKNVNTGSVTAATSDNADLSAGGVAGFLIAGASCSGDKNTGAVICALAANTGSVAGVNAGELNNCIAGGSVNGTALAAGNLASLTQGSSSTGTATGTTLAE